MPRPVQQVEIRRSLVPQPDVIIENNYWGHCTCVRAIRYDEGGMKSCQCNILTRVELSGRSLLCILC